MHQPTIEFSAVSDDTAQHSRRFYRVPVNEDYVVSFFISDIGHRVSEISQTGIGLLLENNQTYEVGERLESCRLHFDDIRLNDLTGRIVHCSPHDDLWKFGIQWTDMSDSQKQQMESLFSKLKKRVIASIPPSMPKEAGRKK